MQLPSPKFMLPSERNLWLTKGDVICGTMAASSLKTSSWSWLNLTFSVLQVKRRANFQIMLSKDLGCRRHASKNYSGLCATLALTIEILHCYCATFAPPLLAWVPFLRSRFSRPCHPTLPQRECRRVQPTIRCRTFASNARSLFNFQLCAFGLHERQRWGENWYLHPLFLRENLISRNCSCLWILRIPVPLPKSSCQTNHGANRKFANAFQHHSKRPWSETTRFGGLCRKNPVFHLKAVAPRISMDSLEDMENGTPQLVFECSCSCASR